MIFDDRFVLFSKNGLVVMAALGTGGLPLEQIERLYKNPGMEYAPIRQTSSRKELYMQFIQPPFDLNIMQGGGESSFWAAGCAEKKMKEVLEELVKAAYVRLIPPTEQFVAGMAALAEVEFATMAMATLIAMRLDKTPEDMFGLFHYIRFARDYQQREDALKTASTRFGVPEEHLMGL